jgi:hypothetical protein
MNANKLHGDILAHAKSADESHATLMDTKTNARKTLDAATADKNDMAKLEAHK